MDSWFSTSALDPRNQVVEQKEDEDQPHGNVAEEAAIVSARPDHGGKPLHAACQQACGAQEVWIHIV